MSNCPTFEVNFWEQVRQLKASDPYGGFNCTAGCTAGAISYATCGHTLLDAETVRRQSSEPIPNKSSPGLNLFQAADVAAKHNVHLEVRVGGRSVTWAQYESRRQAGHGAILQVQYGPIADSKYDAGGGFRGGHAIFETHTQTVDPLADGRRPAIWKYDGRVYERSLMKRAAAALVIGYSSRGVPVHPRPGTVWAAFTLDVVPDYHVQMPKGYTFWVYSLDDAGRITSRRKNTTEHGFGAKSTAPAWHQWPNGPVAYKSLVRLTEGTRQGWYLESRFAEEV